MEKLKMKTSEAVFLIVVGLLLGTVFTFGMNYCNAPVDREETVSVTAVYSKRIVSFEDGDRVKEIILRFEDHEQVCIDGCCITEELRGAIDALEPGEEISALVHPNVNTVLELTVDGEVLMDFDTSVEELSEEKLEFRFLGLFLYGLAVFGVVGLILNKTNG